MTVAIYYVVKYITPLKQFLLITNNHKNSYLTTVPYLFLGENVDQYTFHFIYGFRQNCDRTFNVQITDVLRTRMRGPRHSQNSLINMHYQRFLLDITKVLFFWFTLRISCTEITKKITFFAIFITFDFGKEITFLLITKSKSNRSFVLISANMIHVPNKMGPRL